jgi:hypothetical protein
VRGLRRFDLRLTHAGLVHATAHDIVAAEHIRKQGVLFGKLNALFCDDLAGDQPKTATPS